MDDKQVKEWLDLFYKGETTPEEEAKLAEFFQQDAPVSDPWEVDRQLFRSLCDPQTEELPAGLSGRLEAEIDRLAGKSSDNRRSIAQRGRKLFYQISSAAAVVLILIGLFLFTNKPVMRGYQKDTFTDPREAAIAAQEALTQVSLNLNKGMKQVEDAQKDVDKVNEVMNEQLK